MGLFSKLKNWLFSSPSPEGDQLDHVENGEKRMFDDENGPTLIYSDEPNLADRVTTQDGRGHFSASAVNAATNREIARISQTNLVPGQVVNHGNRPRQMPPQPYPPQQQVPQYPPPQGYPQQYPQQYQQPYPPQYQPQYQQPEYYQAPQQPAQNIPVQQVDPDAGAGQESNDVVPLFPNYEQILVNDTYHLYVDLPGVKKEDLKLSFVGGQLIVGGHRDLKSAMYNTKGAKSKGSRGKKPNYEAMIGVRSYLLGDFQFPFYFPKPVDTSPESFKASMEDGILHVEMKIAAVANGISLAVK